MLTTRITFIHLVTVLLITVLFCVVGCNKDKPVVPDEQKLVNKRYEGIILPMIQLDSIRVIKIAAPPAFDGEFPDICFCFGGSTEEGTYYDPLIDEYTYRYSKNTADQVLSNVFPGSLPQTIVLNASYKFNVSLTSSTSWYSWRTDNGLKIQTSDLDPGSDTCGAKVNWNYNNIATVRFSASSLKYYYNNGFKSIYIKEDFITYILFFHFEN